MIRIKFDLGKAVKYTTHYDDIMLITLITLYTPHMAGLE